MILIVTAFSGLELAGVFTCVLLVPLWFIAHIMGKAIPLVENEMQFYVISARRQLYCVQVRIRCRLLVLLE